MRVPRIVNWIADWFRCPRFEDSGGPWNRFYADVFAALDMAEKRPRNVEGLEYLGKITNEMQESHRSTNEAIQKSLTDITRFSMIGLGLSAALARFTEEASFLSFPIGFLTLSIVAGAMGLNVVPSGSKEITDLESSDRVLRSGSLPLVVDLYNNHLSLHVIGWGSRALRRSLFSFVCGMVSLAIVMAMQPDAC